MSEEASAKIRVLVVDDSAMMRRIITTALSKYPEIEVAGYAVNGLEAIAKTRELTPDVITLDVEMPEMDGLTALREIRKDTRTMPIIMFSTKTHAGSQATVLALTAGATDYVGKPTSASGSAEAAFRVLDAELIPKILGLGRRRHRRNVPLERPATAAEAPTVPVNVPRPPVVRLAARPVNAPPVSAVVIGVSTGGPMALMDIFKALSAPLPVPVFIVQHMPATFTGLLAARLTASTVLDFKEAEHGEVPEAGKVYLAPGGQHMLLSRTSGKLCLELTLTPPENSCRPSVDVLFRSAAEIYGSSLLALMLTGMGYDGLKGCQEIRTKNGQIVAQDEDSSVIWGMPGAVVEASLADAVLPLDKIADELVFRTRKVQVTRAHDD